MIPMIPCAFSLGTSSYVLLYYTVYTIYTFRCGMSNMCIYAHTVPGIIIDTPVL